MVPHNISFRSDYSELTLAQVDFVVSKLWLVQKRLLIISVQIL